MCSTHDVLCKKCGKKLAWWSGLGDNIQHENEWECNGFLRRKAIGIRTRAGKVVKREKASCSIVHATQYCDHCARSLRYKCMRPRCKGTLRLARRRNGTIIKHCA